MNEEQSRIAAKIYGAVDVLNSLIAQARDELSLETRLDVVDKITPFGVSDEIFAVSTKTCTTYRPK